MSFQKTNITGKLAAIQSLDDGLLQFGKNRRNADKNILGDSKNPFEFLMSLLTFIEGDSIIQDALVEITNKVFIDAEGKIKGFLQGIVDDELPDGGGPTSDVLTQRPLEFSPEAFNHNNRLKQNADNPCKQSVLGGSEQNNATNSVFSAIQNPNQQTLLSQGAGALSFNSSSGNMSFTTSSNSNPKDYLKNELIANATIIDKGEVMGELFNLVTGFLERGKSKDQIVEQEEYYTVLRKIIENDEEDTSYFEFSQAEILEQDRIADNKSRGVYLLDFGCSIEEVEFNGDDLCALLGNLDPTKKGATQKFYDDMYTSIENNNDLPNDADSATAKQSFFRRIIDALILALVTLIISNPIFKLVLLIITLIKGGDVSNIGSPLDQARRFISFIQCIVGDIKALIVEYLFDIVKRVILELIGGVVTEIAKEKLLLYAQQLKSLLVPVDIPL